MKPCDPVSTPDGPGEVYRLLDDHVIVRHKGTLGIWPKERVRVVMSVNTEVREGDVWDIRFIVEHVGIGKSIRVRPLTFDGDYAFRHEVLAASTLVSRKPQEIKVGSLVFTKPVNHQHASYGGIVDAISADGQQAYLKYHHRFDFYPGGSPRTLSDLTLVEDGNDG